jgi:hypothetical protein
MSPGRTPAAVPPARISTGPSTYTSARVGRSANSAAGRAPPGSRVARSIRPAPSCHTACPSPARTHSTAARISTAIAYDSVSISPLPNSAGLGAAGPVPWPPSRASAARWSRCAPSWMPRQICWASGVAVDGTSAIAVPGPGSPGRHIHVRRASRLDTGGYTVTCSSVGRGR